ncbi:hypothetical protein FQA39_LY15434 [Lamprigera yunnana]|nr:hypothetical protein FQA39_LY15434 [Lamprigera yunnana]
MYVNWIVANYYDDTPLVYPNEFKLTSVLGTLEPLCLVCALQNGIGEAMLRRTGSHVGGVHLKHVLSRFKWHMCLITQSRKARPVYELALSCDDHEEPPEPPSRISDHVGSKSTLFEGGRFELQPFGRLERRSVFVCQQHALLEFEQQQTKAFDSIFVQEIELVGYLELGLRTTWRI